MWCLLSMTAFTSHAKNTVSFLTKTAVAWKNTILIVCIIHNSGETFSTYVLCWNLTKMLNFLTFAQHVKDQPNLHLSQFYFNIWFLQISEEIRLTCSDLFPSVFSCDIHIFSVSTLKKEWKARIALHFLLSPLMSVDTSTRVWGDLLFCWALINSERLAIKFCNSQWANLRTQKSCRFLRKRTEPKILRSLPSTDEKRFGGVHLWL